MKAFYVLLLLVFLASCGSEVVENPELDVPVIEGPAIEAPIVEAPAIEEINEALDELPEEVIDLMEENSDTSAEVEDSKIVKLETPYINPKGEVDMMIEYTLNSENKIETIDVSATSYDLSDFNASIQAVIGMSVEEASEYYVSGSSLTTAAYQAALQN